MGLGYRSSVYSDHKLHASTCFCFNHNTHLTDQQSANPEACAAQSQSATRKSRDSTYSRNQLLHSTVFAKALRLISSKLGSTSLRWKDFQKLEDHPTKPTIQNCVAYTYPKSVPNLLLPKSKVPIYWVLGPLGEGHWITK